MGIVAGRAVGWVLAPGIRDLVGTVIWVVLAGGTAAVLGRELNSVVTPAGRRWHQHRTFIQVPLQFAGGWYTLLGVAEVAGHYGSVVGAWLGWTTGVVGFVVTLVVTLRWLVGQPLVDTEPDAGGLRREL